MVLSKVTWVQKNTTKLFLSQFFFSNQEVCKFPDKKNFLLKDKSYYFFNQEKSYQNFS